MARRIADLRTFDRFRTPGTFTPDLTFPEACVAVAGALGRIFLGSALFGLWGGLTWYSWANMTRSWLRVSAVVLLVVAFLVSFTALMLGIKMVVDEMMRRVRSHRNLS